MNIALWIVQGFLALLFLIAGAQKLSQSYEQMAKEEMTKYVEDFSPQFIKFLGVVEILGAIGVILPARIDILPWLTPLAAVGLAIIMAGAVYTRFRRKENQQGWGSIIFLLMTIFVAYAWFIEV